MKAANEQMVQEIKAIVDLYAMQDAKLKLVNLAEEVIEAASAYSEFLTPQLSNDDIGKLMFRLTNFKDAPYERIALCGLTLAVIMGQKRLTANSASQLTGAYIQSEFTAEDTAERSSVIQMMRDVYLQAKEKEELY